MLPKLQDRKDLIQLFSGVGVELGVYAGSFSAQILAGQSRVRCLYSIDPWAPTTECGFSSPEEADYHRHLAVDVLKKFGHRSSIVHAYSFQVVDTFSDNSLDFVYIDSSHLYEQTKQELKDWWPKLRSGAIMSGHDYANCEAVRKAVDEFVARHGLELFITEQDSELAHFGYQINSWYFQKP